MSPADPDPAAPDEPRPPWLIWPARLVLMALVLWIVFSLGVYLGERGFTRPVLPPWPEPPPRATPAPTLPPLPAVPGGPVTPPPPLGTVDWAPRSCGPLGGGLTPAPIRQHRSAGAGPQLAPT